MKVKFIKLSEREEIIAECDERRKSLYIKDAAVIISMENGKLVLATWLPYTNVQDGFILPEKAYLFTADVEEKMLEYYNNWRSKPSPKFIQENIT